MMYPIHHMMYPVHHMMDPPIHHMMDGVHHMMDGVHHMMDLHYIIYWLSSKQSESFTIENFDSILSDSFCFSPDYVCPEKDCATPILQEEMTP